MRVVAITGASAGIGGATAVRLGGDGAAVAMCARRREMLEAAARDVDAAGGEALPIVADVTSVDDMERFVSAAVDRFGRLAGIVSNAGFGIAGTIDDISPDQIRKLVDIGSMGPFSAARAALRVFRRQHHGHVVIISSIVGKRGVPYMGAYAATKFAQVGMAECLRAEVAGSPIHVSVVYPVSTESEFYDMLARDTGTANTHVFGP